MLILKIPQGQCILTKDLTQGRIRLKSAGAENVVLLPNFALSSCFLLFLWK